MILAHELSISSNHLGTSKSWISLYVYCVAHFPSSVHYVYYQVDIIINILCNTTPVDVYIYQRTYVCLLINFVTSLKLPCCLEQSTPWQILNWAERSYIQSWHACRCYFQHLISSFAHGFLVMLHNDVLFYYSCRLTIFLNHPSAFTHNSLWFLDIHCFKD